MRRLDRYVLTEMIPPFLFGIGAFLAVLVGVQLFYEMLRLIYEQGFPTWAALRIFLLGLPAMITLTLPMATIFASLMTMARFSGDGELVAMRAGGLSIPRIGAPVIIIGLVVSLGALGINESVVPWANQRAFEIALDVHSTGAGRQDIALEIRDDDDRLQRWLYADRYDPNSMTLTGATVLDFTLGGRPVLISAERAEWQGQNLALENVEYTTWDNDQEVRVHHDTFDLPLGRGSDAVESVRKQPEDMKLAELLESAQVAEQEGRLAWANRLRFSHQMRLALPWACLGFAIVGIPLGIQRVRSSRGIGMGVSLLVIFVYYVILNTLKLVGEGGVASPALLAWTPNVLLYLAGLGLLLRASQ